MARSLIKFNLMTRDEFLANLTTIIEAEFDSVDSKKAVAIVKYGSEIALAKYGDGSGLKGQPALLSR